MQIGKKVKEEVIEEFVQACSDYEGMEKKDIHELNKNERHIHGDGYGFSTLHNNHFLVVKYPEAIFKKSPIEEIEELSDKLVLIHARRASPGIDVSLKNNHPFYWYDENREFVFAHNGTIKTNIPNYDKAKFLVKGTSDSEKYFYSILTNLEKNNWQMSKTIVQEVLKNWDYSGANFILATPQNTWVGVFYKENEKYYTMKLYKKEEEIVVCSSYLPALGKPEKLLKNGDLIVINSKNKEYHELQ
ncbi:MAG: class II glutamine amidotransferase [Candidatus Heimdallarchaeaceae archaeon]